MPSDARSAKRPPGKRERNKAENRRAILAAAQACFLERGYQTTCIRDVIRLTGLSTGTFYNYFPDKPSLLHALVAEHIESLTGELVRIRRTATDLRGFVHGAYLAAFSAVVEDPVLHTLMLNNEAAIAGLYDTSPMGISIQALREDIADAIERKLMPPVDIDLLAAAFYGVGYEMSRVLAEQPQRSPQDAARFATQIFLGGITGTPVT